ncbi:sulfatase family protein [Haladaptatus sp. NG-SE-30]
MNVLFVDIDSLRPDHVGAYGYDKPTTPNIDRFAADAVRFERAYTANSPCMPSRAALISGRYGFHNGIVTHGPPAQVIRTPATDVEWDTPREAWRTLPEQFFYARVRTGAVTSFPRHPAPWFTHIWHEFYHTQEPDREDEYFQTVPAETVTDRAIEYVDEHATEPFFLYTQFWDPHTPYQRQDEEIARFRDGDLPPHPTDEQVDAHQEWDAWHSATQEAIDDREDLAETLAHYDAEIRHVDHHVGRLLDALRRHNLYDETLVVLTADHGEEFGEHGLYREHWSTYDGTQRVPLLIKPPADAASELGSRDQLVTNVDLAPTIAEYAGVDSPVGWQGISLRPVMADSNADWRDEIVVDHGLYTAQRAIRTNRWKLVRTYHPGMWAGVLPERQLFDLVADPWEQTNVAADNPDVVSNLETRMDTWVTERLGQQTDALCELARGAGPDGYRNVHGEFDGV